MSGPHHLPTTPMDPFQWRESVLSTRSISYVSTLDAVMSSASIANFRPSTRRTTSTDDELDVGGSSGARGGGDRDGALSDIPELPVSVAKSLLFNLPREIRDRIYTFCLASDYNAPVEWPPLPAAANVRSALLPQLLRTCKIIYTESAPILYSINCLTFHHPSDANMFVRAIASPIYTRYIGTLSFHIKAQDTRLWMPYLTSTDRSRSLKADFPNVRELGVRYRSNKWHHTGTTEQNMRAWVEDSRLDEVIDGLRHVFYPPTGHGKGKARQSRGRHDREALEEGVARGRTSSSEDNPGTTTNNPTSKGHWLELHHARTTPIYAGAPRIKVICACRIHPILFAGITGTGPMPPMPAAPPPPANLIPPPPPTHGVQPIDMPPPPPPEPVVEGEPFRGFTTQDLRTNERCSWVGEESGSMKAARTPFADKERIALAFELYTFESSKTRGR